MFVTTQVCHCCNKSKLGTRCTYTHMFICKDCNPELYNYATTQEL